MSRYFLGMVLAIMCVGCVSAATKTVGAAAGAAGKATGAAIGGVAAATGAVVSAGGDDEPHDGAGAHDGDPRPFDASRNAMNDVDAALLRASDSGKNVLLVLGGNWCHDSRGLARQLSEPELADTIATGYELVWVDVGHRDRNLDVAERFGVPALYGTPTVLILSPEGVLINEDSVHDWRTADSKPYDETLAYFDRFSRAPASQ